MYFIYSTLPLSLCQSLVYFPFHSSAHIIKSFIWIHKVDSLFRLTSHFSNTQLIFMHHILYGKFLLFSIASCKYTMVCLFKIYRLKDMFIIPCFELLCMNLWKTFLYRFSNIIFPYKLCKYLGL